VRVGKGVTVDRETDPVDARAREQVDTPLAHAKDVVTAQPAVDPVAPTAVNAAAPQDRPPGPAKDAIQDVQLRGLSRWSPRRAGLPAVLDWWPAYMLVCVLGLLAVLITARTIVEVLHPFGHVLVVASVAAVLTFALAPLINRLESRMPRRAAAAVVFFGTLLTILAVAGLLIWQLATEGERFSAQITEITEGLQGKRAFSIGPYVVPPSLQERLTELVTTQGPAIAGHTAEFAAALVTSLIDLVLVLVITFYLLLDDRRIKVITLRTLEPSRRPAARRVFREVARVFGAYIRAQMIVALSLGALVAAALFALGVPYALFLGIFAALAELIPMIGPIVGAVPALIVAATLPGSTVLWVAIALLVIQQIESNVLVPRLTAHAVGLHPIGSILALVLGFEVGGVIGALFAVPVAGLIWVLVSTAQNAWRDRRVDLQRRIERQARFGWRRRRSDTRRAVGNVRTS
ncbi:MAG TPA: AI-2E family transporter, partial [Candidatus Limnocylindrales bacterium]|nr:AI-2E family transporter [Candidatus Limnocylindrales bacterium]